MKLYDVIIIGGGPAGSTAATLLAQKGHNVLLLEKEKFPREHVGESLIPLSYELLNQLGLIEGLKKIASRKPGVNFVDIDGKKQSLWCFKNVIDDESYLSFHVIRSAFDKLLLDNSKKNGATVLEETMVKNVVLDNPDGTVEVQAKDKDGNSQTYHAKFLVDASGLSTFLGSKFGIKKPYADLDRVAIFCHWSNTNYDTILKEGVIKIVYLGGEKKGWIWVIPVSAEHLSIGVVTDNAFMKKEKKRLQDSGSKDWLTDLYRQEVKSSGALTDTLKGAKTDHKVLVSGDYSYYCEDKYGSNYAMVGDAAAFLDPIFSSGIYVGMRSSDLIANAIHLKLTSDKGDEAFTAAYTEINGALKLLEKFIRLFYTPEALNLATIGQPENLLKYGKFEMAYSIFHYLLAGDFFKNYEKYSEFIDMLRDSKTLGKFENLIKHTRESQPEDSCGELFEKMYGEMTHKIEFDKSIL
jgi:flavin-dependent dehydrogenase